MIHKQRPLQGREKAAILAVACGDGHISSLYSNLTFDELCSITLAIANIGEFSIARLDEVLNEYAHIVSGTAMPEAEPDAGGPDLLRSFLRIAGEEENQHCNACTLKGGVEIARHFLEISLGPPKCFEVIESLQGLFLTEGDDPAVSYTYEDRMTIAKRNNAITQFCLDADSFADCLHVPSDELQRIDWRQRLFRFVKDNPEKSVEVLSSWL